MCTHARTRPWGGRGSRHGPVPRAVIVGAMARPTPAPAKEPGRLKQMWQVFKMTRRYDGTVVLYLLLAFLAPIGAGIVLAFLFTDGNPEIGRASCRERVLVTV